MSRTKDQLKAELIVLECERETYVRQISELRRLVSTSRVFVVRKIMDAIHGGAKTSREIAQLIGVERRSVQTRLSALARAGVLQSRMSPRTGSCGHPEHHYTLRGTA